MEKVTPCVFERMTSQFLNVDAHRMNIAVVEHCCSFSLKVK